MSNQNQKFTKTFKTKNNNEMQKPFRELRKNNFKKEPRENKEEIQSLSHIAIHNYKENKLFKHKSIFFNDRFYKDIFIRILSGSMRNEIIPTSNTIIEIVLEKDGVNGKRLAIDLALYFIGVSKSNLFYFYKDENFDISSLRPTSAWNLKNLQNNNAFKYELDKDLSEFNKLLTELKPKEEKEEVREFKNVIIVDDISINEFTELQKSINNKSSDTLIITVRNK